MLDSKNYNQAWPTKTWKRLLILLILVGLIAPQSLFFSSWQLAIAQVNNDQASDSAGENEEEPPDNFNPGIPINALAWGESIKTNLDAAQQALPLPTVMVSGADVEGAREGKIDTRVRDMITYLAGKHTRLKIARITKNYSTDPKQFSKETIYEEDEQANISAHHTGQAFDISEIDTFQCSTKGLFGSKKSPPQPIKVAWQTAEGRAQAGDGSELDTSSFNGLAGGLSKDMLIDIITDRADFDNFKLPGGMGSVNLKDVIKYLGRSEAKNNLGYRPPPGATDPWGLTYWQGQVALSEATSGQVSPSGFVGRDKTQLALNFVGSVMENQLGFPEGSLRGNNPDQMMENFGKRYLEQQVGLEMGRLDGPPSSWLPKIKTRVVQYSNNQTADLSLSLPKGTLAKLDQDPSKALKILGATKFSELTKMAEKTAKNFLQSIDKNQPIKSIPLAGLELPVSISINDAKALFSDDQKARAEVAERLAADTFAGLLNKKRFLGSAYLNLKGQDVLDLFMGKKDTGDFLTELGVNYLSQNFDLPTGAILDVVKSLKGKNSPIFEGIPNEAWVNDSDGNGIPDAYDDPRYSPLTSGDVAPPPSAQQNMTDRLLSSLGRNYMKDQGKNTTGLSDAQAIAAGRDYLKTKLVGQVNHELGLSAKINEATLGLLKITDQDLTKMLAGDFSAFRNIEDKIGSVKIGEALQLPAGGVWGYLKGFISDKDLTVAGALEKLRGVVGVGKARLDSFGANEDENNFLNQKIQEAIARGEATTPDPRDPSNEQLVNELRLQYRLTQQSKSLSNKLQDRAKDFTSDVLNRWFEWDADKTAKYGALSSETIFASLKNLTDKDKANDEQGKLIVKQFVSRTFDSQGDLLPDTLMELIDNPKQPPQRLLDEATSRIEKSIGIQAPGTLKAIYINGTLSFNVNVDQLTPIQQAILGQIANQTKMIKTTGQWHPDVIKFLDGDTAGAFKGWALARFASETVNKDNPFGDRYRLSYDELRDAYFPNTKEENQYVNDQFNQLVQNANVTLTPELEDDLRSAFAEDYRLNVRQRTNAKIMDIELAKQTDLKIQPGFSYAMLYGTDEQRMNAFKQVALSEISFGSDRELEQKLGVNVKPGTVDLLQKYATGEIKTFDELKAKLADKYGNKTDEILVSLGATQFFNDQSLTKLTGIDILPGTADLIQQWAFGKIPRLEDLKTRLGQLYTKDFISYELSKLADKTFGLPAGTAFQMYQYYQQYQRLYATYQASVATAAVTPGGFGTIAKARADFKAQSTLLYVQALDLITGGKISKLTSPLDKALGLPPGTVFNVALAILAHNPVGAAIILAIAILGIGKTTCPNLETLAQQKVHQVLGEIMDNSPDQAFDGLLPDGSLTPYQLITWGDLDRYPASGGYPDWIKDLLDKARNIWDPEGIFTYPVVGKVGFFHGQTYWNVIHVGY